MEFRIDQRSGVPTYLQLVLQVRQALRLGMLVSGDQMPSIREVVARLAINPNTVQKAYRQLELEGLIATRQGSGTFVLATLPGPSDEDQATLRRDLDRWLRHARDLGLDAESIAALFADALRRVMSEAA